MSLGGKWCRINLMPRHCVDGHICNEGFVNFGVKKVALDHANCLILESPCS